MDINVTKRITTYVGAILFYSVITEEFLNERLTVERANVTVARANVTVERATGPIAAPHQNSKSM